MNRKKQKTFTIKLKLCFLSSLHEQFAYPLEETVGNLIDLEVELDRSHEKAARQENDVEPKVINADGGIEEENQLVQLARKSSTPIMVHVKGELVEAYELENKDSSVIWVEYVSDGRCEAVSSDRIFRGRKRKPSSIAPDHRRLSPRSSSRPTNKKLLFRDKSCRFLTGNKITPLDTEHVGEIVNNAIASVSAPTPSLVERQNSINIPDEENLTQYDAPVTDRLQDPSMFSAAKNTPQKQTPKEIQRLQNHHQLDKHRKTASSFVDRNFMTGESLQSCRHCQQSFSTTSGDLVRHEVSCPAKMQMQQRSELQLSELEEEFQLQGPTSSTQDVVSPHQVQVPRTDVGLDLTSQNSDADASPHSYYDTYLPKILLESQVKNDFCQRILQRSVDPSDLGSLSHCSMILTEELDILHQISSDVCNRMTTHQGSHWEGSHVLKTLQSLQIQTHRNIVDLGRLILFLRSRITFAPTFAPQEAQLRQQPQNQEQLLGTLQVDPIHYNWAPHVPPISWTPNHSSHGIAPQEAQLRQQPQNQEQLLGTLQVDPIHYNWAPHVPPISWTPNHSSHGIAPQEAQLRQQPQNQEQLLGTLQVDPIHYNWAPHVPPISWTPNHSSHGIAPQEAPQWQQPQNQEQLLGTPSFNPHYYWAIYTPSIPWTPNHSRTVATPEEQQCQQPQNQDSKISYLALRRQK